MGLAGPICFLGFSIHTTTTFSAHLERRAADLDRLNREANSSFLLALTALHRGIDAALDGGAEDPVAAVAEGIELLSRVNDACTGMAEALVRTRAELYERQEIGADDPLIARERYFAQLDYDRIYRQLAAHGAALPQHVYWDDMVARVRDGGARAGLRLLDRHVRELQSDLRTLIGEIEAVRRLPAREMALAIHSSSRATAAVSLGFVRLQVAFNYFGTLCEAASQLHDHANDAADQQRAAS